VTRSLNISYLKAVPVGTTVHLRSWVVQAGRTMAFLRGEMTSEDGKIVYCTAEHHKVNIPALKEHTEIRTKWDEEQEVILTQEKGKL
jgi:acyl-coenzyme A thioesterase 13